MEETRYQLQDSAASAPQHATSDGVGWRHGGEYVKINLLSSGAGCKVICVCVYNKGPSKLFFEMLNISCLPPSNNQYLHPILLKLFLITLAHRTYSGCHYGSVCITIRIHLSFWRDCKCISFPRSSLSWTKPPWAQTACFSQFWIFSLLLCAQQAVHGHLIMHLSVSALLVCVYIFILKVKTTKSTEQTPFALRLHQT